MSGRNQRLATLAAKTARGRVEIAAGLAGNPDWRSAPAAERIGDAILSPTMRAVHAIPLEPRIRQEYHDSLLRAAILGCPDPRWSPSGCPSHRRPPTPAK